MLLAAAVTLLVAAISSVTLLSERGQPDLASTTINPGNPEQVALGRRIYSEQCAQCHGVNLEGQPNWRSRGPDGRLPAPPHDASGHTWHHPDAMLFRITRDGTSAVVGGGYESDMPGFGGVLSDTEIRAVLAFIKSTWPDRERGLQERQSRILREAAQ
ncbi:cytochrome C [Pseudoroseomonas aestuarii]|uniref:Cytochrome C n=1 Tax=Teichococcus aestuarii TaxID=568898 RepID=A0A2U1UYP1_9PROT|nr:cytochrome C [Pseudoroseomonas aestuarii]